MERHSLPGPTMEFPVLFLAAAVVMIACIATYLHHATDTLKPSF